MSAESDESKFNIWLPLSGQKWKRSKSRAKKSLLDNTLLLRTGALEDYTFRARMKQNKPAFSSQRIRKIYHTNYNHSPINLQIYSQIRNIWMFSKLLNHKLSLKLAQTNSTPRSMTEATWNHL